MPVTFHAGKMCVRLICRHMFHSNCYEAFQQNHILNRTTGAVHPDCPNCRAGGASVVARFRYVPAVDLVTASSQTDQPVMPDISDASASGVAPPAADTESDDTLFPTWSIDGSSNSMDFAYLNQQLALSGGRMGLIVDPGSWNNLMGDQFAKVLQHVVERCGSRVTYTNRNRPLNVGGVGNGSQKCTQDGKFPMALRRGDGTYDSGSLSTPIVQNSHVPGLLGLQTMQMERAILDMANKQLHLCAPGPVNIDLPPGSRTYCLEQAPSGHLLLPITDYLEAKRSQQDQQRFKTTNLVADTSVPTGASASGSSSSARASL